MRISDWSSDVCSSDRGVELPLDVAIVGELDGNAVGQARRRHPPVRIGLLLLGKGKADDLDAIIPCRDLGERAPTATDLEQSLTGSEVEAVKKRANLASLRRFEAPLSLEIGRASCRERVCQYV